MTLPSHIRHHLLQVVQGWVSLQQLLVKGHWEIELHDSQVVDGEAADDTDEVKQVNVLKRLQGTNDLHVFVYRGCGVSVTNSINKANYPSGLKSRYYRYYIIARSRFVFPMFTLFENQMSLDSSW